MTPIGINDAQRIAYRTELTLNSSATYADARNMSILAATNLFGANSNQVTQTTNAWYAVGVGDEYEYQISGPSTVCSSVATFTINNPPQVDSIIWEAGPFLSISSGQYTPSCTFSGTGVGNSWVRATIFTGCGSIILPTKTVHAGAPAPTQITGFEYNGKEFAGDFTYRFGVSATNAVNYQWGVGGGTIISGQGTDDITVKTWEVTGSKPINFSVGVRVESSYCGWSSYFTRYGYVVPGEGAITIAISPNPTTGETTVSIESTSKEEVFDEAQEWDMEIYGASQLLKTKKTSLRGKSAIINTSGWQEGVYIVRVTYKPEGETEKVLTGKIMVKR